ncbi:MAG: DNA-directed RNA polymerase subunit E'' [Thermofilum sp. ex4484_15]|nr:MAG: DNA-directed RNA polymerase subunit E'' [Thermofilum sp. ex4484_15]
MPSSAEKCPYCGSTEVTNDWSGMIIILDKSSSVAEKLGIQGEGKYAIKVR